ncbi:MAG: phosphatase PAP2 family protein [Chloroflexi bacterium]|nr:phosphatase PAP2 family protein [Chloroflexota bacterium]
MDGLVQWGLEIVRWIQTFRNPVFDQFFLSINFLGDEEFYLLFFPIVFWCFSKMLGKRFGVLFLLSLYVNQFLKDLFAAPRPYQVDSKLYAPAKYTGYGIPSSHAQGTLTVWGYLATQIKSPVWWIIAVTIPLCVGIGRMYLGDHFPQDVLLGWALGIVFVAVYVVLQTRVGDWLGQQSMQMKLVIAVIVPIILAFLHFTLDTATLLGTMLGFYVGLILEERWIGFDTKTVWWKQVIKLVIGLAVTLGLRFSLKAILPPIEISNFVRYGVIGLWISLGAPWVFVKGKLAESVRSKQSTVNS